MQPRSTLHLILFLFDVLLPISCHKSYSVHNVETTSSGAIPGLRRRSARGRSPNTMVRGERPSMGRGGRL